MKEHEKVAHQRILLQQEQQDIAEVVVTNATNKEAERNAAGRI